MEQQTMGKRIMALRREKGLTQEQLAERLGLSAQAVSKWENDVSCPDISLLPQLAETLGVSTDELLGVKPIQPRVVVVDAGKQQTKGSGGWNNGYEDWRHDKGGLWFAVLIILLGAVFLLERLDVLSVQVWDLAWPAVVLALGVGWCVKRFSFLALGVAALGLYYLIFNLGGTEYVLRWSVIWPVGLILLGFTIVTDRFLHRGGAHRKGHHDHDPVTEYSECEGSLRYSCAFAEDCRKVESEVFSGGSVDMSFGKSVLDLTAVKSVRTGAVLSADVSFGSFELLLPRSVRAVMEEDKAFGSIAFRGAPDENASQSLFIRADVSFGSMTIRYQ